MSARTVDNARVRAVRAVETVPLGASVQAGGLNFCVFSKNATVIDLLLFDGNLTLSVCHFPPGTSKWNQIEHRLFSFISQNWRGRPLVSHQAIVNLIAATTTRTGLRVKAALDTRRYATAVQLHDEVSARLRLTPPAFHGDWNYTIAPRHSTVYLFLLGP